MQHDINNVKLTLVSVQEEFKELRRRFFDQFARILQTFLSSDGSLNRFMSSHIATVNGEQFIQYPDAQLYASTKHQGEYAEIDESTGTVTRRIDIKRRIDVCFDYRNTKNNTKNILPDKYETGIDLLNNLLSDTKYDYYQDYFNFDIDTENIQQTYNTIATVQQFPNNYDSSIMFSYFNLILSALQLRLLQENNSDTDDTDDVDDTDDNTNSDTEIFTGNTHDVYITGCTNIYIKPGEYQNVSIINSSSINLYSSYNLMINNSNTINLNKTVQHLIINNCKFLYSISQNRAYNLATHNTLSNINFATQIQLTGNYSIQNCNIIVAIMSSKNIQIDTIDVFYCNNCTDINIYNCTTFNCTNLNNLSQKFTDAPNIFYNAQITINLQANSQLQTLWQGVSLNVDKIHIIYPTISCQNISINTTQQSQETNTKEINIVGNDIWGYDINHQWGIIGSLQDTNKKSYAVYNYNGFLTTVQVDVNFVASGDNIAVTIIFPDYNVTDYQLLNIYIPDQYADKTYTYTFITSKLITLNKIQLNNIQLNIVLNPYIVYIDGNNKQYFNVNTLQVNGKNNNNTVPQISITYDENFPLNIYQYFNEIYFYNSNLVILEDQVQFVQKLQNIQFVVNNLRSYKFIVNTEKSSRFGGLFTRFKLSTISNPYVTEIPANTFYKCQFTDTDFVFPAVTSIGESAFETDQPISSQKQYNFTFNKLTEIGEKAFKGRYIRTLSRNESITTFVGNGAFLNTQIENINFINTNYNALVTNIFNSPTLNILIDTTKFTQNIFTGTKNLNIYPIDYWFPHKYVNFPSTANVITNLNIINTVYGNILAPTQIITTGVQSYVGNSDINDIFLDNNKNSLITLSTTQNINIASQTPINIPFVYANNTTQIMLMEKVQGIYLNKAILGADIIINSHHFFCKDLRYNNHTITLSDTNPLTNFNVSLYSHQTPTAVQRDISFVNAAYVVADDINIINNLSTISGRGTQDITFFCKQADKAAIIAQHQYITTGQLIFVIL